MKSLIHAILFVAVVAIVSLYAQQVQADPIYGYDFNDRTVVPATPAVGNLTGQDGWVTWDSAAIAPASSAGMQVVASPTPLVNNSTVVKAPQSLGTNGVTGSYKSITPISFSSADNAVEQYVQMMVNGSGDNTGSIYGGFQFDGLRLGYAEKIGLFRTSVNVTNRLTVGEMRFNFVPNNYGLDSTRTNRLYYVSTEKADLGDWYEFKGVMDFSYLDEPTNTYGLVTWYKKNLSQGETDFSLITFGRYDVHAGWVYDGVDVTSIPMGLTTSTPGQYTITSMGVYAQRGSSYELYADNLSLGEPLPNMIPEPSTLAMLGMGLVGLLAYAWKKRK